MQLRRDSRLFEIPYNFDKNLILMLKNINISEYNIYCFYLPPSQNDYNFFIDRGGTDNFLKLPKDFYNMHINFLQDYGLMNKLQLLLQSPNKELNMPKEKLQQYINLGFSKFCVGNIEQAILIKELMPKSEIVGSITMHTDTEKIEKNLDLYKELFVSLVLDFSYCKNLQKIKELPKDFKYILLINSECNIKCMGDPHWYANLDYKCPGMISTTHDFYSSCLIRPMDLHLFDPYIYAYKIQDRGWPTSAIIRDIVLYTTDYSYYPNIIYDEKLYQQ